MAVSKAKDSGDEAPQPRTEDEVKRLRDAVLFAWEHLHTVVKNNGGSGSASDAAPPSSLQQVAQQLITKPAAPAAGLPKYDATTTKPTSLNDRQCTKVVRAQSRL
ncbi:hypothetical protein LWI29_020092 [Acer saccharum]|uniref:Uncharacterized protein n=1 Tax=Acer saccharum TaxID=4024 RepID=A0AA39SDK6_ACESA|nr:hypothetical protein LWI29_020092 [Acer saccharum]KAK1569339.1 hypothetical protein Q3G72_035618 [Acer saccharum]